MIRHGFFNAWVGGKTLVGGDVMVFGDARVGGKAGVGFGETINSGTYNDNNNRVIRLIRPQFPFQFTNNNISGLYGSLIDATKDFDTQTQQTAQHGI